MYLPLPVYMKLQVSLGPNAEEIVSTKSPKEPYEKHLKNCT